MPEPVPSSSDNAGMAPNHKAPSAALGALFVFRTMVGVPRFERGTS
jgi:hypothetical protein